MSNRLMRSFIALSLIILLAACQSPPPVSPTIAATDVPDTDVPTSVPPTQTAAPTATATATPTATAEPTDDPSEIALPAIMPTVSSEPADDIWAYPGPIHYEGDLLDVIFAVGDGFANEVDAEVQIDSEPATTETAIADFFFQPTYRIENFYDTTGKAGPHTIRVSVPGFDLTYRFEVLPADQRPAQEANAEWQTLELECCVLHYITDTAAARDIEHIAELAQESTDAVEALSGRQVEGKFQIVLMDRMWFNGGFGGSGSIAISYTDRPYGSLQGDIGLRTVLRHEATHALGGVEGDQFMLGEGIAVYYAGGHYKPEPFAQRGAALYDLGWYTPIGEIGLNHETRYLQQALLIDYIAEVYGEEGLETFMNYRVEGIGPDDFPEFNQWIEGAAFATTGQSMEEFEAAYTEWLDSTDPGDQLEDLYLTVVLQELRREYQRQYAPYPMSLFIEPYKLYEDPTFIPDLMREPHAPENIAFEVLLMHAQQALQEARYEDTRVLIDILHAALIEGDMDAGLMADYREIAAAAAAVGYEVVDIEIDGDGATVQAIAVHPEIEVLMFRRDGDGWIMEGE